MDWKSLPKWAKSLSIISMIIIILFFCLSIIIFSTAEGPGTLVGVFLLAYIGIIIGMWILGFLNRYLIVTNKKWLANVISGLIPLLIIGYFTWAFIWQITHYPELIGSFSQNAFFLLPLLFVIIYFIVSLVLINQTKK